MRFAVCSLCSLFAAVRICGQDLSPPSVVRHPASVSAHIGDTATLSAAFNSASSVTYQWQKNGAAITGATTPSLTFTSLALADTGVYHVVAANAHGTAATVPALLEVTKRPQSITLTPATTAAVAGSSVVLTATSTSSLPVTLTLVSGSGSLNGNFLTSLGGNVVVRASQPGDATFAAAEPVERTYTFVSGSLSPFITSPPADQTVVAGASVTFRAAAIGTPPPAYQWEKDGVPLAGATTATLSFVAVTTADAGRYTLVATNPSGTASASATLTVRTAPVIITAPSSQTVFTGDGVTLRVTATGVPTPTYQWRKNGGILNGATNATLAFASAATSDTGRYDVVVTNLIGSVTSPAAMLAVTPRDFSGTYFGRLGGTGGDFALHVRPDRSAVLLAHATAAQSGIVAPNVRVEPSGDFSVSAATVATPPQTITLRGKLDETSGVVSGTLAGLPLTFEGMRAPRTGPASALAGLYTLAAIGTAGDRGYMLVAPDAQTFVISSSGSVVDSAKGSIDGSGRFVATTIAQAALDLAINNGVVSGTARAANRTSMIAGAIEGRAGIEHLANLSVRTVTSNGAANLITGFVITGPAPKQVLIRAAGPALAVAPFNVANVVGDPTLQVFRGTTAIGQNDDWGVPAANSAGLGAAATRAGAFPFRAGSQDAALLMTLTPGAYTVVIGGGTGTALAEIYEVLENNEAAGARRLANVSARGLVTPAAPFIAGFVISGAGPQRVLIRGIGPTLGAAPFNVAGTIPNPQLALYRGATVVKANDDWFRDADAALIRDAAARSGAFALGASSLDAAILTFLEPGAYTAQISATNANASGLALIEVYEATP